MVGRWRHRPGDHLSDALALLRRRPQFRALWGALALSSAGSGAAVTALTLYVQQTRGTGTAVAALLVAEMAPRFLGALAGNLADRVDQRQLMIGADLGQAVLFVGLASLPPFPMLLALAALTSSLQTVHSPARTATLPALVDDDELLTANGLTGIAFNLYVAVGPLVGGLLFAAAGASGVMLINAATFVVSAQLTRRIPRQPHGERQLDREREGFLASTRTGLRYALGNPITRVVTLTILFMFAFVSIDNVALVFLVRDTLGGSAAVYGLVSATFGIGMLLGSLGILRGTRLSLPVLYLIGVFLSSLGALLTGFAPTIAVVALIQVVCGSGNGIEIVSSDTIFQRYVPRGLLGRVYGVTYTAVAIGSGVSMLLGGILVDAASPRVAFYVAGAGGLLVTAVAAPALLRARDRQRG